MRKLLISVIIKAVLVAAIAVIAVATLHDIGLAEDEETTPVYVTARILNGRMHPSKRATVEAVFWYGDELQATGAISRDHEWIEVRGGECETVWVCIKYVTERFMPFTVTNENNGRVKIRSKHSGGKLKGYVKHGKSIEIDQVVLGWGHTKKGWVDLEYFIEVVE